jgi:hypothetical protein
MSLSAPARQSARQCLRTERGGCMQNILSFRLADPECRPTPSGLTSYSSSPESPVANTRLPDGDPRHPNSGDNQLYAAPVARYGRANSADRADDRAWTKPCRAKLLIVMARSEQQPPVSRAFGLPLTHPGGRMTAALECRVAAFWPAGLCYCGGRRFARAAAIARPVVTTPNALTRSAAYFHPSPVPCPHHP